VELLGALGAAEPLGEVALADEAYEIRQARRRLPHVARGASC
jgi:hypothetical protein